VRLTDPAQLTVSGEFAQRLGRAIEHLQALNRAEMRRELTTPDAQWHWGADYIGRWLGSMALLSTHTHQDYGCEGVARELMAFQQPDGSFGTYGDDHDYQEWFGMGRGLVGLLDYHSVSGDQKALNAARRLGDFYAAHYPESAAFMRECYASGLEGLVRLAEVTGEAHHLQTAQRIAHASPVFQREWYSTSLGDRGRRAPCGGHVHCQLSTARGLLDLYRLTREQPYHEAVLALHNFITREALWISGGVGFYFNRPEENEACADADWLRLNLALWQITGEAHYLDLAENVLVNQLYFAQVDSGAFCYLRGLQNRGGATFDVCCSHHAPRAMWEVMRYLYTASARGVWVNLLLDGAARLSLDEPTEAALSVASQVRYEAETVVLDLTLGEPPPFPVAVHVRVPRWAGLASVFFNGQPAQLNLQHGYASLERTWRHGDGVELRYPRLVDIRPGQCLGRHVLNPNEVAVFYGPHLYCASDRWNEQTNLHLVRVTRSTTHQNGHFVAIESNRLETTAVSTSGEPVRLVLSPLSEVGGAANGIGRSHPVSTSPFRVWLPLVSYDSS
jgi:DUF1680 family protein